jgi:hypothetical protein
MAKATRTAGMIRATAFTNDWFDAAARIASLNRRSIQRAAIDVTEASYRTPAMCNYVGVVKVRKMVREPWDEFFVGAKGRVTCIATELQCIANESPPPPEIKGAGQDVEPNTA